MMIIHKTRKMDKITLLRVYDGPANAEFNASLTMANIYASQGELIRSANNRGTVFKVHYKGKSESTSLRIRFFGVGIKPAVSIMIVPRKLTDDEFDDVVGWLSAIFDIGVVWTTFRLNSIEIAIDYCLPFKDLLFIDTKKCTYSDVHLADHTFYIGAKKGRARFRIYDKKKQLAEKKDKHLAHESTRVELVLSGLKLSLNEIEKLPQSFDTLITLRMDKLAKLRDSNQEDIDFRSFCEQVIDGVPAHKAYWLLKKSARLRIANLLKPHALKLQTDNERWSKWLDEQQILINEFKDIDLDPGSQFTPKFSAINCTEPIW